MTPQTATLYPPSEQKKRLTRRLTIDNSQQLRHTVQIAFVLLNVWLGIQFYLWVRFFERGGAGLQVPRPAGAEGWLPIAGLMNFKYFLPTGRCPAVHPAAMFLFMAFVGMSLRRQEIVLLLALPRRNIFRSARKSRQKALPPQSPPATLARHSAARTQVPAARLLRLHHRHHVRRQPSATSWRTPYGLIADVKMLNFFRDMSETARSSCLPLWSCCRFSSRTSGAAISAPTARSWAWPRFSARSKSAATPMPASIAPSARMPARPASPVDKLVQIRSVECTACMACIASCPAEGALQFSLEPARKASATLPRFRRPVTPLAMAAIIAFIFLGTVLVARATNHWQTHIPNSVYQSLVPNADQASHPGY